MVCRRCNHIQHRDKLRIRSNRSRHRPLAQHQRIFNKQFRVNIERPTVDETLYLFNFWLWTSILTIKKNQPLSVVSGVADGGVAIWVSSETIVSQTIGVSTTESTVAVSSIQIGSIGLGLSISGPLGNMDNTSRVSNVSSGSGVQSGGSRDGSGGSSGDSNAVGNIGDSVTGGIAEVRGGVGRDSGIRIASQATVGEASIPVWAVESVSIS